jgi:hypothetical protein
MRMSDRTQSSVRTGSRGEGDVPGGEVPAGAAPVTSTQSIPGASTPRTQGTGGPITGAQPATTSSTGSSSTGPSASSSSAVPPLPATGAGVPGGSPAGAGRGRGRGGKAGRGPRRARLQLRHVDIWSAFKISFVLAIAMFFIWMVAIGVLYGVLSALGVFTTLNELFGQLGSASGTDVGGDVVTPGLVFGGAAVIGAINIVLMTALCTVGTFIYNLCADLVGGIEITLSER